MNALAYLAPAFFMFTMHIAMGAFRLDVLERYLGKTVGTNALDYFVYTMDFIYALMVVSIVFFSLNFKNTSKYFIPLIYTVSTVLGIFIWIIMFVLIVDIIRGLIGDSSCIYIPMKICPITLELVKKPTSISGSSHCFGISLLPRLSSTSFPSEPTG
jgi:hypothetical protein